MKRLFLLSICGLFAMSVFAQTVREVYCEIVCTQIKLTSPKCAVAIDYGQDRKLSDSRVVVDELGNTMIFNSVMDALNWMGTLGWKFKQAYTITDYLTKDQIYHYLFAKELKEGEQINDGIRLGSEKIQPSEETLLEEAKKDENKAYIAFLVKSRRLDSKYKEEVSNLFPMSEITPLIQNYSEDELRSRAKNHNKFFNKYDAEY